MNNSKRLKDLLIFPVGTRSQTGIIPGVCVFVILWKLQKSLRTDNVADYFCYVLKPLFVTIAQAQNLLYFLLSVSLSSTCYPWAPSLTPKRFQKVGIYTKRMAEANVAKKVAKKKISLYLVVAIPPSLYMREDMILTQHSEG